MLGCIINFSYFCVMIVMTKYYKGSEEQYIVYENFQEFNDSNNTLITDYINLNGNYYKTIDGYYIPIIPTPVKQKKLTKYNVITYKLYNGQYLSIYYNDEKTVIKHIKFQRDYVNSVIAQIPKRYHTIVYYLLSGWDIYKAVKFTFPKYSYRNRLSIVSHLFNNKELIKIIGDTVMKSYQQIAIQKGADKEFIVTILKNIAQDPKANAKLREFAITQLITFNQDISSSPNLSTNNIDYDKLVSQSN